VFDVQYLKFILHVLYVTTVNCACVNLVPVLILYFIMASVLCKSKKKIRCNSM
jgi:hypothetical protein